MKRGASPLSVQGCHWGACVLLLAVGLQAHAVVVSLPLPSTGREPSVLVPVLVEVGGPPAARVFGSVLRSKAGIGGSSRVEAAAAARAQIARNRASQETLLPLLVERFAATEIFRVTKALNAIAVLAERKRVPEIARVAGVRSARVLPFEYPTNATSVPFIGAPPVWGGSAGLGSHLTGAGVRIGIIDTGVDYIHSDFGGTGNLADYQANDPTAATTPFYPSPKVVGGVDLAGDAYDGNNLPVPDANPMDCYGHGTHVAGTAAGFGVTADGSTYVGSYGPSTPFSSLQIGPGVAPRALLYGIRIFGCGGGSVLGAQGIEWALDPNGDDDLSDHLDVINMSFGDDFGDSQSATAVAADNAAYAGVVAVASAGNGGDAYFIHGSPGSGSRVVSVANAGDPGVAASYLAVTSPASIAGNYAAQAGTFWNASPPHPPAPSGQSGTVVAAVDATAPAGDGCQSLTNAAVVAGKFALVDAGGCAFNVKLNNVNLAGAAGLIVVNDAPGDPELVFMGGLATPAAHIPSEFVSADTGNALRAHLAEGVNVTFALSSWADRLYFGSSRGPSRSGSQIRLKPDLTAPGLMIESARSGVTCKTGGCLFPDPSGFLPGNGRFFLTGTSMAAPHVAGTLALLRESHPDWTPEQLKAVVMNTALHGLTIGSNGTGPAHAPDRAGAGRVDAARAAAQELFAMNADEEGLVSLSFEASVVGLRTQVKKLRVVNTGSVSRTFDVGIDTVLDAPGVSFSLPGGGAVVLPAGGSGEIEVRMDADASRMKHALDPSVSPTKVATGAFSALGTLPRHWLTSEAGFVVFRANGGTALRVPLFAAAHPDSQMAAASPIATGGLGSGSGTIALSGQDACTGIRGPGPVCTGSFPNDEVSLVSPFELQVSSSRDPLNVPGYADLQYAGVAYRPGSGEILFGVSTWERWSTPSDLAVNVYVDANSDGAWDKIVFNTNPGSLSALYGNWQPLQDSFLSAVYDFATDSITATSTQFVNRESAAVYDSRLFDNRVLLLPATADQLGLGAGSSRFRYKVVTCPGWAPLCELQIGSWYDQAAGPFSWDQAAQGLDFTGSALSPDLNGASLPVSWNLTNLAANGSLGALLLHHHNVAGREAQVIPVGSAPSADLAVTVSATPAAIAVGLNVVITLAVTNAGPDAATGVSVVVALPAGLTHVSDDGGGAFDSSSGVWAIPALGAGSSRLLHLTARVDTSDPLVGSATVGAASPLDPNPANDRASVTMAAPRSADLVLTMEVSSPTTVAGSDVTYTMSARNLGPDPAYGMTAVESFPAVPGLRASSFTASQGLFDPTSGLWSFGSLASGATATLSWTVPAPIMAGALTSSGGLTAETSDPDTSNNAASATTIVVDGSIPIPAVSVWGLGLFGSLIALAGVLAFRTGGGPSLSA